MDATKKDFRIFHCIYTNDFVICNDFKYRLLKNMGYPEKEAKYYSHGHLKSKRMCYVLRDLIIKGKIPKSHNLDILECYIRISHNPKCIKKVKALIDVRQKKGKKPYYININKGVVRK